MPSFGGLISGVMGRAAEGYGKAADMEMKKQSELDLRKQLLDAETEKQLRIDEIKRGRDIAEEDRKMSPEYIAKVNAADLEKSKGALGNRKTLAPLTAEAATEEYKAGKPLEDIKTTDAIKRKIEETVTLSKDKDFIAGETKLSMAKGAATIEAQRLKNEGYLNRPSSGGAGGKPKSETTADLDRIVKRSEADAARILGVDKKDLNRTYSNLQKKKDPASVALFEKTKPYMDELDAASTRLKNWKAGAPQPSSSGPSSTGPRDLTKYEAKAD